MEDLEESDAPYYKKFNDVPFSGKVTRTEQGTLKNGKWEGAYVIYWYNGQLRKKGNVDDNQSSKSF